MVSIVIFKQQIMKRQQKISYCWIATFFFLIFAFTYIPSKVLKITLEQDLMCVPKMLSFLFGQMRALFLYISGVWAVEQICFSPSKLLLTFCYYCQ